MPVPRVVPPHWLYRVGALALDVNHHRALWSFTWLTTDPPISDINTAAAMNIVAGSLTHPFGFVDPVNWSGGRAVVDVLYPDRRRLVAYNTHDFSPFAILNPAAPEAAMRLQRVGGGAHPIKGGRISFPIRDDSWFTDLPHRRQLDVARFQPKFNASFPAVGNTFTNGGRTYLNVVYNRRDNTWIHVTHHVLLPNPIRIWQRWRTYLPTAHASPDALFVPPEIIP